MPQRLSDVPLSTLVPEIKQWNNNAGIELGDWIACVGTLEHMIAYAEVLLPDFVLHDDCVLVAGFSDAHYQGFMSQTSGNRQAVEATINHCHIAELFTSGDSEPSREQIRYLGRLLKEIWSAKLRCEFPDREFVVSFPELPTEPDADAITFYERRTP